MTLSRKEARRLRDGEPENVVNPQGQAIVVPDASILKEIGQRIRQHNPAPNTAIMNDRDYIMYSTIQALADSIEYMGVALELQQGIHPAQR